MICSCFACTHPSADNAAKRVLHAERHAEFEDWLADRADTSALRASIREQPWRARQEMTVWTEARPLCHDPRCYAALPHFVHLVTA